ncbi:MAG: hypothetical protein KDB27_26685 [Planctomycetales bacterium]|nr:hypothetical protein [Planctomycetales bacterium]
MKLEARNSPKAAPVWFFLLFASIVNGQEVASNLLNSEVQDYPVARPVQFTEMQADDDVAAGEDIATSDDTAILADDLIASESEIASESGDFTNRDAGHYYANGPSEVESGIGQWPTFATYLKAGPSFGFGGFFKGDRRVGFALQGGVREGFGSCSPWFFDLGGSFQTSGGRGIQAVSDGFVSNSQLGIPNTPVPDALTSTLREIRRGSIQTAIGYYLQPLSGPTYEMLFSLRFGSRLGHAKADFDRVVNPDNQPGTELLKPFADSDDFLGLFAGVEWVLSKHEFLGGDMSFVVDGEVANEWLEFDGLKKDSLPTAAVLFGLTVRR